MFYWVGFVGFKQFCLDTLVFLLNLWICDNQKYYEKNLSLAVIFVVISRSFLYSQDFEFYTANDEGEILAEIENNDTVFYEVAYSEVEEDFYFLYNNVSGSLIEYDLNLEIYELANDVWAYCVILENEFLLDGSSGGVPSTNIFNLETELENDSLSSFRISYRQQEPGRTNYRISFVDPLNEEIKLGSIYVVFEQWEGLSADVQDDSEQLTIFPNPSNGIYNITIEQAANIQVTDLLGQVVHATSLKSGTSTLDLSHLEKGMYQISFFDPVSNEYQVAKKWVMQ